MAKRAASKKSKKKAAKAKKRTKKTATKSSSKKSARGAAQRVAPLKLPEGFVAPKAIAAAEANVYASKSAAAEPNRFICIPSGPPPYPCLRYRYDPATGQYFRTDDPPMDCDTCRQLG